MERPTPTVSICPLGVWRRLWQVHAIGFFIASAGLLIWLYVGLPARIPLSELGAHLAGGADQSGGGHGGGGGGHGGGEAAMHAEDERDESVTALYDGSYTIACIDIHIPGHNAARNTQGFAIATLNTLILLGSAVLGYWRFRQVRRDA